MLSVEYGVLISIILLCNIKSTQPSPKGKHLQLFYDLEEEISIGTVTPTKQKIQHCGGALVARLGS